jgi:hypothetical protein
VGDLVYDIEREAVGRVVYVDRGGNLAWLAPEQGDTEWTALPEQLRPVADWRRFSRGVA